jgi:putative toxin-antitoxin system antitoxin component (TIGR02293 family)
MNLKQKRVRLAFRKVCAAPIDNWPIIMDNCQSSLNGAQMKTEDFPRHAVRKRAAAAAPTKSDVVVGKAGSPKSAASPLNERGSSTVSCNFLGGKKYWHHRLTSRSDVHSAIVSGVPYGSLIYLVDQVKGLEEGDVAKVLGISTRTLRRQSETPEKPMPADLASKTWLFAETLAKATEIFGGKEEAERWMSKPAMGLDDQRPIDLLQTVQGAELVNDFLGRLEYGVYT